MDKALNEIGKLRNEMKIGFIEVKNQIKSVVDTIDRFSQKVERGFVAIEDALDTVLAELKEEIDQIKKRLDDANI